MAKLFITALLAFVFMQFYLENVECNNNTTATPVTNTTGNPTSNAPGYQIGFGCIIGLTLFMAVFGRIIH